LYQEKITNLSTKMCKNDGNPCFTLNQGIKFKHLFSFVKDRPGIKVMVGGHRPLAALCILQQVSGIIKPMCKTIQA
jgi:hypothetical protein